MQFRVYDRNPVNVNICYIPTGAPHQLGLITCNYKYITPTKISVEAPKPFYYAIDENNHAWRTIDVKYITNTKVMLTMISQTLTSFSASDEYYEVVGDINASYENFNTFSSYNRVVSSPSTWLVNNLSKYDAEVVNLFGSPTSFDEYCVLQTINPIFVGDGKTTIKVIVDPWGSTTNKTKNETTQRTSCSYVLEDEIIRGGLGVFTYLIKLNAKSPELDTAYRENVVSFLTQLSSLENGQNVINARFIKVPKNYFENSYKVTFTISKEVQDPPPDIDVDILVEYNVEAQPLHYAPSEGLLKGRGFWRIGENVVFPNIGPGAIASLNFIIILGVGTCFGFFYTGLYRDVMVNSQSSCLLELGYNISPNTVGESLYYSNKQYQSIIDSMPFLKSVGNVAGAIGAGLATPGGVGAKLTGFGIGLASSAGSASSLRANREREQSNHGSLNNANDVQNLGFYMGNNAQVAWVQMQKETVEIMADMLAGYNAHTITSEVYPENTTVLKCSAIPGEINTSLYKEGCIIATTDNLLQLLSEANI